MRLHRIGEHPVDLVHRLVKGHAFVRMKNRLPIPVLAYLAVPVPEIMGGAQTVYVFKKGFPRDRILKRKIAVQRVFVEFLHEIRMLQQAFDLAGPEQPPVGEEGIMHGLDAEIIPRDEQRMVRRVPDHKGEHPPQPGKKRFLPLLKAVEQHLAVGFGGKDVAFFLKLGPQRL